MVDDPYRRALLCGSVQNIPQYRHLYYEAEMSDRLHRHHDHRAAFWIRFQLLLQAVRLGLFLSPLQLLRTDMPVLQYAMGFPYNTRNSYMQLY